MEVSVEDWQKVQVAAMIFMRQVLHLFKRWGEKNFIFLYNIWVHVDGSMSKEFCQG